MKRIIALLLIVVLGISLLACNDTENTLLEQQYQEIKVYLNDTDYFRDQGIPFFSSLNDLENGSELSGKEALLFSYNWLTEHSDYKDCADYLSRFTLLEDALTSMRQETYDAFGQSTIVDYTYRYNDRGKCFELSDLYDVFEFINVFELEESKLLTCQYDENDRLVSADLGVASAKHIKVKITLMYDERDNIIEANFLNSNGESWSNTFTYNEANQLATARYAGSFKFEGNPNGAGGVEFRPSARKGYYEYIYDEAGIWVKEIAETETTEYRYNEYGQLAEVIFPDQMKAIYVYDENGCISCIEYIAEDTVICKNIYYYSDRIFYANE